MNAPVPPESRPVAAPDSTRPAGETWVWLTAMGLAAGLLMVFALLSVIAGQGVSAFWPKRIELFTLVEGSDAGLHNAPQIAGAILDTRPKATASYGNQQGTESEALLFVGNREVYELSSFYLPLGAVVSTSQPASLWLGERRENGAAIFYPLRLERPGQAAADLAAADAAALGIVRQELARLGEGWRDLKNFERDRVGSANTRLRDLALRLRGLAKRGTTTGPEVDRLRTEEKELKAEVERLSGEARQKRQALQGPVLHYRLATGEERHLPLASFVRIVSPNGMSWSDQLGYFFERGWEFLTEEPREANTEGGIFPALFGTLVMTVLMSAAVMPFGVLAAIYLREYARDGLLLRSVRIAVNNLAGVPSIVFGVFGLGFFVYVVGAGIDAWLFADRDDPVFGTGGMLWASLTLALLTVPVVIVATEEALAAVPRGVREASLACGASKWQTIQRVVLPAAAPGMLTGLILAMARGAGEVAPLMLVGVVKLAPELPLDFHAPYVHLERKFMHLGFHIYDLGFQSPDSDAVRPMVFATTLLLITLVVLLNLTAIIIRNRLRRKYAGGSF